MSLRTDDRGVSIAVTHVLTIGITTILIGGLIIGAGSLLDGEQERAADRELRAVGEGLANEMVTVAVTAEERELDETTVTTNHPMTVTGQSYTVLLTDDADDVDGACSVGDRLADEKYDACLVLDAEGEGVDAEVPLNLPEDVEIVEGSAAGGDITVTYERIDEDDKEITIGGG